LKSASLIALAAINDFRYYRVVIKSFADKDSAEVFARGYVRRIPPELHRLAWRKLAQLHASTQLDSLRIPPGNRLEPLKRDRVGQHSIRINDQWRICFAWKDGNAYQVEIVDYH
jgi:proteic killer suppression protein